MPNIIDGKKVSAVVKEEVAKQVELLKKDNINSSLAVVLVGEDPASKIYVNNKKKACQEVGIISYEFLKDENTTQEQLIELIKELNERNDINGILVQLPLPKHISEKAVIDAISPIKDVDAFNCLNVGKIMTGSFEFSPCTPAGIMELLKYYNIQVCGKNCVVVGRSNIVGKPMAMLLLHNDATVTICHSKTKDLQSICANADILISAVGKANFIKADMVKESAVVIDVGMNRDENGKLCGDVAYDEVKDKVSFITPVPGGVGPMTISMLMKNTVVATKIQNNI